MENRGYSIYEVGILGGNDKVKTNLFVLSVRNDYLPFTILTIYSINIKENHLTQAMFRWF